MKNPNWWEADQLAIHTTRSIEELNSGLPRTNPGGSGVEDLNQGPPDFTEIQRAKSLGYAAS